MNYRIESIAYYVPETIVTNAYLAEECGLDRNFLDQKVGIKERRIAAADESTSDMACKAARKLFEQAQIVKEDIQLVLLCTQNPDYKLPTTACLVQAKLGLSTACIAFDINLGCSGFVYAMAIAGNFIRTGMVRNALLIMADQYSRLIDVRDKNTVALFGDAASAILLKACDDGVGALDYDFGTDGRGAPALIAYNSGVAHNPEKPKFLYMDGREIFKFSITRVPESVTTLLAKHHLDPPAIRYFIFHQANHYMLGEIRKRLHLSDEQMIIDMEMVGNTVSSTIPIALKNLLDKNTVQPGDLMVFCGFGVGLSWGSVLYKHGEGS